MSVSKNCCKVKRCCVVDCFKKRSTQSVRKDFIEHFLYVISGHYECEPSESVNEDPHVFHDVLSMKTKGREAIKNSAHFPVIYGYGLFHLRNLANKRFYLCDKVSFEEHIKKLLDFFSVSDLGIASPYLSVIGSCYNLLLEVEQSDKKDLNSLPHVSCLFWFVLPKDVIKSFELMASYLLNVNMKNIVLLNLLGERNPSLDMHMDDVQKLACCMVNQDISDRSVLVRSLNGNIGPEAANLVREVRIRYDTGHLNPCIVASEIHSETPVFESFAVDNISLDEPLHKGWASHGIDIVESVVKTEPEETANILEISSQTRDIHFSDYEEPQTPGQQSALSTEMSLSSQKVVKSERCTCVADQLLQCPACCFVLKGGDDRANRLIDHVKKCHKRDKLSLIREIRHSYPSKLCPFHSSSCNIARKVKLASCLYLNEESDKKKFKT